MHSNQGSARKVSDQLENSREFSYLDDEEELCGNRCYETDNLPVDSTSYIDPWTRETMLMVTVGLPGGATFPEVEITTDGMHVIVNYTWSQLSFDAKELFRTEIERGLSQCHPKIEALQSLIDARRSCSSRNPKGSITVKLLQKAQTDSRMWSHSGVGRDDGAKVVIVILSADEVRTPGVSSVIFGK